MFHFACLFFDFFRYAFHVASVAEHVYNGCVERQVAMKEIAHFSTYARIADKTNLWKNRQERI